jgi:hypothetical protein
LNYKFPSHEIELKNLFNTSKNYKNSFSIIEIDSITNNSSKFSFDFYPFVSLTKKDSSNFFIDSIKISQLNGNIKFSDSLFSNEFDSLLVDIEIKNIEATLYTKNDSIFYDNESAIITKRIKEPFSHKISVQNSCQK